MQERVFLLVDGSNFYHRLRENNLAGLLKFNYGKFTQFLIGDRESTAQKYYVGAVREEFGNPRSRILMANQQKLVGKLKKYGWQIGLGTILKSGNEYHEKGVDVLLVVDLLVGAYENLYDTIILVSSDTDLLPAMDKVRSMGKKVEYVGFGHKPSLALITHSDIRRLLTIQDLEQFVS